MMPAARDSLMYMSIAMSSGGDREMIPTSSWTGAREKVYGPIIGAVWW